MLEKLKEHSILKSQTAQGLEVILSKDNSYRFNGITLHKRKEKLEVEHRFEQIDTEGLKKELSSKKPVLLSLSGKGIIHKKTPLFEEQSREDLLLEILPNANAEDFFLQTTKAPGEMQWVSLIRKDLLIEVLEKVKSVAPFIQKIFLSPMPSTLPVELFNLESPVALPAQTLHFTSGKLSEIQSSSGEEGIYTFKIGKEILNTKLINAFGAALYYFFPLEKIRTDQLEILNRNKEEFFHKQIFVKAGVCCISLLLIALLTNFFFFNHYNKSHQQLSQQALRHKQVLADLDTLTSRVNQNKAFLQQSSFLKAGKLSYYADQIGQSVPHKVRLRQINIHPLDQKIEKDEKILLLDQQITLKGEVEESTVLNSWIKLMEEMEWTETVNIMDYHLNKEQRGIFEIKINYKSV